MGKFETKSMILGILIEIFYLLGKTCFKKLSSEHFMFHVNQSSLKISKNLSYGQFMLIFWVILHQGFHCTLIRMWDYHNIY